MAFQIACGHEVAGVDKSVDRQELVRHAGILDGGRRLGITCIEPIFPSLLPESTILMVRMCMRW